MTDEHLSTWLRAEVQGDEQAAEAALRRAFQRIPRPSPAAGFADRVLARTRREASRQPALSPPDVLLRTIRILCVLALVSLAMFGSGALLLGVSHPIWLELPAEGMSVSSLTDLAASLLSGLVQLAAGFFAFASRFTEVIALAGDRAARSSTAAVAVAVGLLVAWSAFGALRRLITREGKSVYART